MAGLREKQKEDRQRRILEAARQQFRLSNYRDVTIEAIAEVAGLSAMTVFNYYGSKGGLLLSLVAESDQHLIEKIDDVLKTDHMDAVSAVISFSLTIFDHAFSYLDQKIWGHVLSTSIREGNSTFGRGFKALEDELRNLLSILLERLKERELIYPNCDCLTAATVIYNVHNARFMEFSSGSDISREEIDAKVIQDLQFVVKHISGIESPQQTRVDSSLLKAGITIVKG